MSPPLQSYASALHASLAALTSVARSRSSTDISEPAVSPRRGAEISPCAPIFERASAATVTFFEKSEYLSAIIMADISFETTVGARRSCASRSNSTEWVSILYMTMLLPELISGSAYVSSCADSSADTCTAAGKTNAANTISAASSAAAKRLRPKRSVEICIILPFFLLYACGREPSQPNFNRCAHFNQYAKVRFTISFQNISKPPACPPPPAP